MGATNVKLTVQIKSETLIKASGKVIITVPEYYTNAGSNYMISTTLPSCTGATSSSSISVNVDNPCSFSRVS